MGYSCDSSLQMLWGLTNQSETPCINMSGFLIPFWINSCSIYLLPWWSLSWSVPPDPELQNFPSLLVLHPFTIAKAAKTVLPNSTEAGASGGKTAGDVLCRLISLLTLFHLDSFMDRLPKFLSPRQSNLKPQWELDGVALFIFVSRRAWGSRHFFFPHEKEMSSIIAVSWLAS